MGLWLYLLTYLGIVVLTNVGGCQLLTFSPQEGICGFVGAKAPPCTMEDSVRAVVPGS